MSFSWLFGQERTSEVSNSEPHFQAETVNVVVDVIVTDRHGHHVQGLKADDFKIYEDGVAQKVVGFIPSTRSALDVSISSAATNSNATPPTLQKQPALSSEPHLLTVVLDLADNSPANTKNSADAVLGYLDKADISGDYVAIYYIDRGLHIALPFTNDLQKARGALKEIETRRSTGTLTGADRATTQGEVNDLYRQAHPETVLGAVAGDQPTVTVGPSGGAPPPNNLSMAMDRQIEAMRSYLSLANMFQARAVFSALRAICLAYRDMPGRKNVILFSEGFSYSDDARPAMEAVADAANLANVSIYVIDPKGVEVNPYGAGDRPTDTITSKIAAAGAPGANVAQHGGETKFDAIKTVGNLSRGDQLDWLADITGGLTVRRTYDLLPAFSKVIEDARDYYSLSYVPERKESDGKFRAVKIEVADHAYQLRYRKGYWATPRGAALAMSPAAAQLITGFQTGVLKASSNPEVHADLLLAPNGLYSVPVLVSIPGNRVPLEKEDKAYRARMTLVLAARDSRGNLISVSQREWNIKFDEKDRAGFEKTTVTLRDKLSVNRSEGLNVEAIIQLSGNTFARGSTFVHIPNEASSGFGITSLLLSDRAETANCPDMADSLCFMNMRLYQPVTFRFKAATHLVIYFAVSDLALDAETKKPRLAAVFTLKSGEGTVKPAELENLQSLPGPVPSTLLVLAEYDLKALKPGNYALQVTAKDLVRNKTLSEQREFGVE